MHVQEVSHLDPRSLYLPVRIRYLVLQNVEHKKSMFHVIKLQKTYLKSILMIINIHFRDKIKINHISLRNQPAFGCQPALKSNT